MATYSHDGYSSDSESYTESLRPQRDEFLFAERTERNLAGCSAAYATASRRAKEQATLARSASEELLFAHVQAERSAKKLQQFNKKKLTKRLFPKSAKEKAAKYEERVAAAFEKEVMLEEKAGEARSSLKKLEMEKLALESKAAAFSAAQARKHNILEQVFNGSFGTEEENSIEEDRDRIMKTLSRAKHLLEDHLAAMKLLKSAKEDLEHALPLLRTADSAHSVDLFSEHGGGLITDAGSHLNLKNATKLRKAAHQKMVEAAERNEYLPLVQHAKANSSFAKVGETGFNIAFGDAHMKSELENAFSRTRKTLELVSESIEEQSTYVRNAKSEVVRLEKEHASTCHRLETLRSKLLRELE